MKKLLLMAVALSMIMVACKKDNADDGPTVVTVTLSDTAPINMPATGGTKNLTVTADGDWEAKGATDWCTITPSSGKSGATTVTITVRDEKLDQDRNTTLTFGDQTITVTQKKTNALILTQSKYDIPMTGATIDVEINYNVDFELVIPESFRNWISKTTPSPSKALNKTTVKLVIASTTLPDKRYGEVYVMDKTSDLADTIQIYQVQKDDLVLVKNNQVMSNEGGIFSVELRTNIDYAITIPTSATWIRVVETKALRSDTKNFIVDKLTGDDNREVEIIFKDRNSALSDTLYLCQLANNSLFLNKSIYNLDAAEHVIIVDMVKGNYDATILEGNNWIYGVPISTKTKSIEMDSLKYFVDQNYSAYPRVGVIAFKDKATAITDTIKIFQVASSKRAPVSAGERLMAAVYDGTLKGSQAGEGRKIVLVSWRMLPTDPDDIAFDIYRNGVKINTSAINTSSCFQDLTADRGITNEYHITLAGSTEVLDRCTFTSAAASKPYMSIPLNRNVPDGSLAYLANDGGVGDLDGDGQYEIVVKREVEGRDPGIYTYTNAPKGTALIEAYKLDGTFLWSVDLGVNIWQGQHTAMFLVYDFDGDGRAEVVVRTSELTRFGDGTLIPGRSYMNNSTGRVVGAPEYLSVIDGTTGRELTRTNYIAVGNLDDWGKVDDGGNRASRYVMGVAYVDGIRPSIVMCRGYYGKSVLEAWNYRGGTLSKVWRFDTTADGGKYKTYEGQGSHGISVGDVDGDGKDEIVYGACAIDHDGSGLYTTRLGHGDALHLGKFDPTRSGLQVWMVHEAYPLSAGGEFRDAGSGALIFGHSSTADNGRGLVADIDPASPGCEMWSSQSGGIYSCKGVKLTTSNPASTNMAIWWDGSLNRNLLDATKIDSYKNGRIATFYKAEYGCKEINGTKANPTFYADIFGDWREEVIYPSSDQTELRVLMSDWPTVYRFPYLMSDHIYRLSAAHQNIVYNQPTHTGYYIGSDLVK